MDDRFSKEIKTLVRSKFKKDKIAKEFLLRLKEGRYTRDENLYSHFCVYFAACAPKRKMIFIGHHKKSGLWLFNGGHIDYAELADDALKREIGEEWGMTISQKIIDPPKFLTVTQIENPSKQICRVHFDIWYFVFVNRSSFRPDQKLLEKEFYEMRWLSLNEGRKIVRDRNTIAAIDFLERKIF